MADISKINAVALANIAKLDAVTAANIAKVNGLVFSTAPAFVGLLDETYGSGAAAAYSTRRLASSATNLMRVREDSGDTETDIGYDSNNELDTAAIATHCGTANGFVVKWYDQSGNGNDAEQPTLGGSALQPKIYDGTSQAVITENGQPTLDTSGGQSFSISVSTLAANTYSVFHVSRINDSDNLWVMLSDGPNQLLPRAQNNTNTNVAPGWTVSNWYKDGSSVTISTRNDVLTTYGNTQFLANYYGSPDANSTQLVLFDRQSGSTYDAEGKHQEYILWPTDQDSAGNRTAIEVNVNNHFAIGNLPNPTSGLLFDYPDAAAAYSVRQLSNTAPLCMRVRRDTAGGTGDDDEADVLFDFTLTDPTISLDSRINNPSAGVASTTLGEFLNATGYTDVDSLGTVADGFCGTFYDQSGAGNDAEQTAFGSQPQIFDSASPTDLIQENGKPAVLFDGTDDYLDKSTTDSVSGFVSLFTVATSDSLSPGAIPGTGRTVASLGTTTTNGQRRANIVWNGASGTTWYYYTSVYGANNQIALAVVDTQYLHSSIFDTVGNQSDGAIDGGTLVNLSGTLNSMTNYTIRVGTSSANEVWSGYIQEIIAYKTDQETAGNRSGIETNLNSYFSIY